MTLTNTFGFSIGGIHSSSFNIRVYDIKRNVLPELTENLLNIPARKGSYFTGLTVAHRVIQIDINIISSSHADRLHYIEGIAYWLLNNAQADQEIVFDDETERVYFGHIANSTSVARQLFNGKATLEIHCSDPFKYGTAVETLSADSSNMFLFNNNGSADIFPKFTTNFANDASFVSYVSPMGTIQIGKPSDASLPKLPATTNILTDSMLDASTWITTGANIDTNAGYVTGGAVQQNSDGMGVANFGTTTAGTVGQWHGVAVRKNLPSTVKDFTVKANVSLSSKKTDGTIDPSQLGLIEIYLYDSNNVRIGKMRFTDGLAGYNFNIPSFIIGSQNTAKEILVDFPSLPTPQTIVQKDPVYYTVVKGDNLWTIARRFGISLADLESMNGINPNNTTIYPNQRLKVKDGTKTQTVYSTNVGNYNDFFGQLTLQRIGTTWYAEIKRLDNGNNDYRQYAYYYDTSSTYSQSEVAYITIWMAQMDSWTPCTTMEVNNIQVIQNNTVDNTTHQPTIFHAGDELVVDCDDNSVWLNGGLLMNQLDIGSVFFKIPPSTMQVLVMTDDSGATHSATYTPRYL